MCGRYAFYTDKELREIKELLKDLENDPNRAEMREGEVSPSHLAPVLVEMEHRIQPVLFRWGFTGFDRKGLIINARAETAQIRPMFLDSVEKRRCVIPTTGFFEWDGQKKKHFFQMPDSPMVYLAGIYRLMEGEPRFVILTTRANHSVSPVHDRMPLVIQKDRISEWIQNPSVTHPMLLDEPPALMRFSG